MAHFAELSPDNTVLRVVVVNNLECVGPDGNESEAVGVAFCKNLFGGEWVQTSYNNTIRKNYAGIGFTYDSARDAFIAPKPFASWVLNEDTCRWDSPTPYPTDGKRYVWNEATLSWENPSE